MVGKSVDDLLKEIVENYWKLDARVNALEIMHQDALFTVAMSQPNPREWLVSYVNSLVEKMKNFAPPDPAMPEPERHLKELIDAMERRLEFILREAANLPKRRLE